MFMNGVREIHEIYSFKYRIKTRSCKGRCDTEDAITFCRSSSVQKFLGMANYQSKFVPYTVDLCEPLRREVNGI